MDWTDRALNHAWQGQVFEYSVSAGADSEPAPVLDDEAFVQEIRAFLTEALTDDLREAGRKTIGAYSDISAVKLWHRRLYQRGWIAPTWPKAFGGTGWTVRQRYLFDREVVAHQAPVLFAAGMRSIGPLLIEMGTPEQRQRYLKPILEGRDFWCQGFSEPQAGSDLAALSMKAKREGNAYVLNGSKIWTTGAHDANRMFALVRTDDTGRKQEGLTFLLLDMDSPGLTISPIRGLSGEHELNQVFFEDVRVPVQNRIGAENDGWSVAKRLMALARSNNTPAALVRRAFQVAARKIAEAGPDIDPALRRRLAGLSVELDSFEQLELAALPDGRVGTGDPSRPSMLKLIGSELHQKMTELAMEVSGPWAAISLDMATEMGAGFAPAGHSTAKYFAVRAATIYSGSSETQRNVLAKSLLA